MTQQNQPSNANVPPPEAMLQMTRFFAALAIAATSVVAAAQRPPPAKSPPRKAASSVPASTRTWDGPSQRAWKAAPQQPASAETPRASGPA